MMDYTGPIEEMVDIVAAPLNEKREANYAEIEVCTLARRTIVYTSIDVDNGEPYDSPVHRLATNSSCTLAAAWLEPPTRAESWSRTLRVGPRKPSWSI